MNTEDFSLHQGSTLKKHKLKGCLNSAQLFCNTDCNCCELYCLFVFYNCLHNKNQTATHLGFRAERVLQGFLTRTQRVQWWSSGWVASTLWRLKANTTLPHNHHPPQRQPAPHWRRLVERQQPSSSSLLLQVPSERWPAWRTARHQGIKCAIRSQMLKTLKTCFLNRLLTVIEGVQKVTRAVLVTL